LIKNRYFLNTYWLLAEKTIRLAVTIITASLVARYLGPERLGKLSFIQGVIAIFTSFISLGMDSVVVQELLNTDKDKNHVLGSVFLIKLITALISFAVIFGLINAFNYSEDVIYGVYILSISFLFHCFTGIDYYFQSQVKSKFMAISNFTALGVGTLGKLWLIYINAKLEFFFIVLLLEGAALYFSSLVFYYLNSQSITKWKPKRNEILYLLKRSWPLIISSFSIVIYMKIDQVMIQSLLGYESVGYYSAALRLTETWYFIPLAIVSSFYPSLVNTYNDSGNYKERFQLLYDGLFVFSFSLALITTIFSEFLVNVLYGESYLQSTEILSIQIWTFVFVSLGVANVRWFILFDKQKITMAITLMACGLNIFLNYFLIKSSGVKGAAIATVLSSIFSSIIGMLFFYSESKENFVMTIKSLNPFGSFKRVYLAISNRTKF
jgi:O-antigen/teichoic acid export membrane protein